MFLSWLSNFISNTKGKVMSNKNNKQYTSQEVNMLIEQLDSLLSLDNEDGIVLSLQGSWGIGKTFFWNNYITHSKSETEFVNISLFGINSLEDIKKQIILKIYDGNKIDNFLKNHPMISEVISKKLDFDILLIASHFTKSDFKNIVVCFDDFERISPNISLSEILGFISELKEQHCCKVVLINNNDMLKAQDELNHKKHIEIDKNNELVEKHFITQTNNQEIFNKYAEKIIDVILRYEPHLKDNIELLKEKHTHQEYIDWEILTSIFSEINDRNKKTNIRLIKKVLLKLDLLQEVMRLDSIDVRIKNGILLALCKGIADEEIDLSHSKIGFRIKPTLEKELESLINKHSFDLDFFKSEAIGFSSYIYHDELYEKIQNMYHKYLFNLKYKNNSFCDDFYKLLNTKDENIVELVGITNFKFYIEDLLKKLDEKNEKIYTSLFMEKLKIYIKSYINNKSSRHKLDEENFNNLLKKHQDLQTYYEIVKRQTITNNVSSKKDTIERINDVMSNSYNQLLLESLLFIDNDNHKEWMIEDREYFELIFDLMQFIQGFSENERFIDIYNNIIVIYIELSKNKDYKYKMEFILNKLPLTAKAILKMFYSLPEEEIDKLLIDTATSWALENSKKYLQNEFTPMSEFIMGFTYYLESKKSNQYYKTIEIAMREYFSDPASSGINFFE